MKRLSFILLLCAIVSVASAQKITYTFQDNPLSEALKYIQAQATDYNITFIYDELEDFRVTTHIQNKSVPEAILQIVGFYPVRVVKSGKHEIYVECTHKTDRHLTGTIIDEQGQPVYITKRFDVVNGVKESSQEDFATVLQMTEEGSDLGLMDGLSPKT